MIGDMQGLVGGDRWQRQRQQ